MAEQTAHGGLRLERLQFVARPRTQWEALDLGMLVARRWYLPLLASWFCLAVPVLLLVLLVLPDHPFWAMVIVWWFKPAYERLPLRVLSAAIFGAGGAVKDALRGWRGALGPGLLQALTFRRLAPSRSASAPILMLEGLPAAERPRRAVTLLGGAESGAFWLWVLGLNVEMFLVVGFLAGIYLFIPSGMDVDWWGMLSDSSGGGTQWLVNVLYFVAMAVVAPIYVACGFALYLNRRVELEAWDIELGFRRLAQRVARAALVVMVLGGTMEVPPAVAEMDSFAEELRWDGPEPGMEVLSPARQSSREAIHEVLVGPDFNEQRTVRIPRFLHELLNAPDDEPEQGDLSGYLEFFRAVAQMAEVVLWALVIGVAAWLIYRSRVLETARLPRLRRRSSSPPVVMGVSVPEDTIPNDVPARALELWGAGARREACSLVYRGALHALVSRFQCQLSDADTEADCLTKAHAVLSDAGIRYFRKLTRSWQLAAYADAPPASEEFAALCGGWGSVFDAADD